MFLKIIIDATILLDHTHTYDNIDNLMDMLINGKFIEQQAAFDIDGQGINEELKGMAEKELEKRIKEIRGKNAKDGKKKRTIQKNRNENQKN